MDRFTVMKSFVSVIKSGSFAAAARGLGISRGLVSRHIADLEGQVRVRLLNRTTRSLSLTEAGRRYFEFCNRILDDIAQEDSAIVTLRDKPEGSLSVVAPKWIGSLDLGDAIASFALAYPLIKVRLDVGGISEHTHGFIQAGYNVAFHTKYLRDSSIMVKKVASLQFALCASPEYIAAHGEPREPRDLASHQCLVHVNDLVWHFSAGAAPFHFKPQGVAFSSNTYLVLHKAARAGIGIALLPVRSVYEDVCAGRLAPLLADCRIAERPLYAAYPPGGSTLRKLRCFIDFIADWFKEHRLPTMHAPQRPAPAPVSARRGRSSARIQTPAALAGAATPACAPRARAARLSREPRTSVLPNSRQCRIARGVHSSCTSRRGRATGEQPRHEDTQTCRGADDSQATRTE